jgi:hypothetical protein
MIGLHYRAPSISHYGSAQQRGLRLAAGVHDDYYQLVNGEILRTNALFAVLRPDR